MNQPHHPGGPEDTPPEVVGDSDDVVAPDAGDDLDGAAGPLDLVDVADQVEQLNAQLQENEALLRTVLLGVDQQITQLQATVTALAGRLAELSPAAPAQQEAPAPAPRAWADYATARDWQELAGWVDWLARTYDLLPSRAVLPCWPAHLGVAEELAALRTAWQMAASAGREQPPNDALTLWHDRWLHPCLLRLRDAFQQKTCLDKHTAVRPGRTVDLDLLAVALTNAADSAAADPEPAGPPADPATGELLQALGRTG